MQDEKERPERRRPDCITCIKGDENAAPKKNKRRNRYCWKFSTPEEKRDIFGVSTREELIKKIEEERQVQERILGKPTDFDKLMRGIGMCLWSWPVGETEYRAYFICSRTVHEGGVTMPYPALPLDEQPNLFFEYTNVYSAAINDYFTYQHSQPTT